MLLWMMNMEFKGGGVVTPVDEHHRRDGLSRRSGYPAWAAMILLLLIG